MVQVPLVVPVVSPHADSRNEESSGPVTHRIEALEKQVLHLNATTVQEMYRPKWHRKRFVLQGVPHSWQIEIEFSTDKDGTITRSFVNTIRGQFRLF